MLPYVTDSTWPNPDGYLTYNNSTAPNKAAGSVTDGPTQPTTVTASAVGALLATASELTVYNLTGITDTTIPAGKKLYLIGSGNTISTADFNLTAAGAELIVKEGAVLDASTYKIEGNVTNNGTIESTATVAANQKALLTLNGAGTVELSGTGDGAVHSATLALTQNVEIADSGTLKAPVVAAPFSGGKTITISGTGVLDFGVAVAGLSLSGVTIVNKGTAAGAITTATASDAALAAIMGAGGKITASADITALTQALTVPEGVTLTAASATFATGAHAVTVDGTANLAQATFAAATSLAVGEDANLTAGEATLAAATAVTINGTAALAKATLAGLTDLTVNGSLTLGNPVNVTNNLGSAKVSGTGELTLGNTDFSAAKYAALLNIKNVTSAATTLTTAFPVNNTLTLTGTVASSPNVTVSATGTLTVTGSLAVTSPNTIVVGEAPNTVTLTKATITGTTGATLTGATGTVTLADTDELELAGTGTIVVAGDGSVVLANSTFGAGTYTATGPVTISSLTAGDTIVTDGGSDTTDKFAVGVLILGEASTASTSAATYTLVKAGDGTKVLLDAANGKITLPADTGTDGGASLTVTAYAGITLSTGSIELGRKASGAGAGKLVLITGATIGTFTEESNTKIADTANLADADDSTAEVVDWASANTSGGITLKTVSVFGAKGASGYASIATGLAFTS
jgi:hypothetical protein